MNIQNIGSDNRMLQNCGFTIDYALEFPNRFPQCFGNQQQPSNMGLCFQLAATEEGLQGQNFWPDNSSSTIIGQTGSPASAFYATEVYMGLTQFDFRDNESTCNSQLSKIKHHVHIPSYTQSENYLFPDSPTRQLSPCSFLSNNSLQSIAQSQTSSSQYTNSEGSFTNPFSNLTEKERLLRLKNKLLDHCDNSNKRQHLMALEGKQEFGVASNLYGSYFASPKPSGRSSGSVSPISNDSATSGAVVTSKPRIRWTQELHDRFVECVNCLGGACWKY